MNLFLNTLFVAKEYDPSLDFKNDEIKLCKNCTYYRGGWLRSDDCMHPNNLKKDFVSGKHKVWLSNSYLRGVKEHCGKSGKWFKKK